MRLTALCSHRGRILERWETRVHEAHDEAQKSRAFVHLIHFVEDLFRDARVLNFAQASAIDVPRAGLSYISQTILCTSVESEPEVEREEDVQETLNTADAARVQQHRESN